MPHLTIEYSQDLDTQVEMSELCRQLAQEIATIGLYPLGGIRVRAYPTVHVAIADLHEKNNFVDMVFRIGQGRNNEDKKRTGNRLMAVAERFFAKQLDTGFFMLSLEIVEIQSHFSWKVNSVHQRLNRQNKSL